MARRVRWLGTRRRKQAAAALGMALAALVAGLAVVLAPGVERAKRAQASALARSQALTRAALIAAERRDQTLHEEVVRPSGGAGGGGGAWRRALVGELERAVLSDARARVRAGTLVGQVVSLSCEPYAVAARSPGVGAFACLAVTGIVRRRARSAAAGRVGVPFWGRIDFARGRLAWCRITPHPGEGAFGRAPEVALPRLCDLSRSPPAGW